MRREQPDDKRERDGEYVQDSDVLQEYVIDNVKYHEQADESEKLRGNGV